MAKEDKAKTNVKTDKSTVAATVETGKTTKEETVAAAKPSKTTGKIPLSKSIMHWISDSIWHKLLAGLGILLLAILILLAIPATRRGIAGTVISQETMVTVTDTDSKLPVGDVNVSANGEYVGKTDDEGRLNINDVSFNEVEYSFVKEGYDQAKQLHTAPIFGDDELPVSMTPNGLPMTLNIVNLAGEPIESAAVRLIETEIEEEANQGSIRVIVPLNKLEGLRVTVNSDGYQEREFEITGPDYDDIELSLPPAGKDYYLSNRDGRYDIYESNLDGSAERLVLEGNGREDGDTALFVSPSRTHAALITKRDEIRYKQCDECDESLVVSLFMVDLESGSVERIDEGAQSFSGVGWYEDTFVYRVYKGWQYEGDDKHKTKTAKADGTLSTIYVSDRSANYFGMNADTIIISTNIYNRDWPDYDIQSKLIKINISDGNTTTLREEKNRNTDSYTARSYSKVTFRENEFDNRGQSISDRWFELNTQTGDISELDESPQDNDSVGSITPINTYNKFARTEFRDGKSIIIVEDAMGNEKQAVRLNDISVSVIEYWINDRYLVVFSGSNDENAHYLIDLDLAKSYKINNLEGPNNVYYYSGYYGGYGGGGPAF